MAQSINHVTLLGRAGGDAELKSVGSGKAEFSLATGFSWKDEGGTWQEKTQWHKIVAWNGKNEKGAQLARQASKIQKGDLVAIEGEIEYRSWEDQKSGQTKYITEIRVMKLVIIGKTEKSQQPSANQVSGAGEPAEITAARAARNADPKTFEDMPGALEPVGDEDLPF